MTHRPPLGVIADDLTGAADIAGVLRSSGARTRLYPGLPAEPAAANTDALVIALKTRSAPVQDAIAQSLQALDWLQGAGARQIVFKICSTFDSTPEGNIGPVALALLRALKADGAAVCPAFPANGRTVYQGHLFVGDRLLHESGMQNHPLTPMTDPDLRRWLSRQTGGSAGHLPLQDLRRGQAAARLDTEFRGGSTLVICDAIADEDLYAIGRAVAGHALVVGGSAVAMGLFANFSPQIGTPQPASYPPITGPGCILAGSCSATTQSQIARHALSHPVLTLTAAQIDREDDAFHRALAFLTAERHRRPLVSTSAPAGDVANAQAEFGREVLSRRIEGFFARLALATTRNGFAALVVAGGETAGAVAQAFGSASYAIGADIAPGVPALYAEDGRGIVLKSGNFGGPAFFDEALDALAAGR
jgi:uncharacterized protein YgbK (DUF1537 family)